ncbi:unnamed protein product [Rhodiola kirilowii]
MDEKGFSIPDGDNQLVCQGRVVGCGRNILLDLSADKLKFMIPRLVNSCLQTKSRLGSLCR